MITISIYPPHKTTINQALAKSKKLTRTWYIMRSKLVIHNEDIEEVVKVLDKLDTSYRIE